MSKFTENWKQFGRNGNGTKRVVNVPWCADEFETISSEFSSETPDPDFKPSPLEKELYRAFHLYEMKFYPRVLWDHWKNGSPEDDYDGMIADMRWDETFYCC